MELPPSSPHHESDPSLAFLLAEYDQINEERRRSRSEGPNRLNFFLTIASSVLGGLVLLAQVGTIPDTEMQGIAILALLFLCLVGWDTFIFSVSRDVGTDYNLRAMARIRRYFTDNDPSLRRYLSWQEHDDPTPYIARNASSVRSTTQAMLSIFCGLISGLLINLITHIMPLALIVGASTLLGVYLWLHRYATRQLSQAHAIATRTARFPRHHTEKPVAPPQPSQET